MSQLRDEFWEVRRRAADAARARLHVAIAQIGEHQMSPPPATETDGPVERLSEAYRANRDEILRMKINGY